jgi:putative PIN family toxin of toxin-antitoxin system
VSGLLFGGQGGELLEHAQAKEIELFISTAILEEILSVISRPRFRRTPEQVAEARMLIEAMTQRAEPELKLQVVKDDPSDDKILECAVAAGADLIVSGDKHLLKLKEHAGIPIVRLTDFVRTQARER